MKMLQPFQLGDLTLPNRVVMAPLTRSRAGKERIPNPLMAEYYVQPASAGLIIAEATTVSEQANGWLESPGVYTTAMEEGWRCVTSAVHAAGGRIFLQLWHMGRASHSDFHGGSLPVSASAAHSSATRISSSGSATAGHSPRRPRWPTGIRRPGRKATPTFSCTAAESRRADHPCGRPQPNVIKTTASSSSSKGSKSPS
jgi:2,4-dienoyl-CoA reductase-like NADH-dependent reductase (Old Yellow Enzyme family)